MTFDISSFMLGIGFVVLLVSIGMWMDARGERKRKERIAAGDFKRSIEARLDWLESKARQLDSKTCSAERRLDPLEKKVFGPPF